MLVAMARVKSIQTSVWGLCTAGFGGPKQLPEHLAADQARRPKATQ